MGLDLVDIFMFREQLSDVASTFVEGTFTQHEQDSAQGRPGDDPARHLAARFAAKEALIKAWSLARWGESPRLSFVDMCEIEVRLDEYGRPSLMLHGTVKKALEELGVKRVHVSLTHEGGMAGAVVILESTES
ncbi:MAG: holo-ACP synthase [Myxococcota bacterium]